MTSATALRRQAAVASSSLDTQTVTVAQDGTGSPSFDRRRGYISGAVLGSISDGTSNIYAGAAITKMAYDETSGQFQLTITGATDSGWTTMTNTTDGTSLTRASRSSFASGTWTWNSQALNGFFTTSSGPKTVTFT